MLDDLFRQLMMGTAVCREGEGGGGGGGDGGAGGGASGGAGGGDGGDGGGGGGTDWTPPEGLPDAFRGTSADDTLGRMLEGYNDLNTRFAGIRDKLAKMPAAPEKADSYQFKLDEKVQPYFGEVDKNPIAPVVREAAFKHGLGNDQLNGFINEVYGAAGDAGLLLPPLDPAAEIKGFASARGLDEKGAEEELSANDAFAKGLFSQLPGIPDDAETKAAMEGVFMSLTDTREGNLILSALRQRLSDSGIRPGGQAMGGEGDIFPKEKLRDLSNDPRADPKSDKYDKEFREKLDRSYAALDEK